MFHNGTETAIREQILSIWFRIFRFTNHRNDFWDDPFRGGVRESAEGAPRSDVLPPWNVIIEEMQVSVEVKVTP